MTSAHHVAPLLDLDDLRQLRDAADRVEQLTGRQVDVLLRLARGLSQEEIATELYISSRTVKAHVAEIATRLGLRSRVQLGMVALLVSGGPCPCGQ